MTPGLHKGVALADYLALDAIGSSRLEWLAVSPLHYWHMKTQPPEDTEATRRGSALHMAALEPDLFETLYSREPDPEVVAPGYAKPRATSAYKEACAALEMRGMKVLKSEEWDRVQGMAAAVRTHPHAARILARAAEREVTGLWERDGRLCRGRFDVLGDGGILADVKTTRSLRDFSPWTVTKRGYYRQMGWYADGLRRLERPVKSAFLIAVESAAPYDVGVFVLEEGILAQGLVECEALIRRLEVCELTQQWPGMFPELVQVELADAGALDLSGLTVEEE